MSNGELKRDMAFKQRAVNKQLEILSGTANNCGDRSTMTKTVSAIHHRSDEIEHRLSALEKNVIV